MQDIFDALDRQFSAKWQGKDMLVMEQVVVKGPGYRAEDCRAPGSQGAGLLGRVKKVVSASLFILLGVWFGCYRIGGKIVHARFSGREENALIRYCAVGERTQKAPGARGQGGEARRAEYRPRGAGSAGAEEGGLSRGIDTSGDFRRHLEMVRKAVRGRYAGRGNGRSVARDCDCMGTFRFGGRVDWKL